ncbi:MAG: NAD(P)H-dependent oxidoreductase [Alphaproteobacteria bacterium]|nr:NAD(P)H-dependent oxidoreductase [Alphaproteobacteria bacterium]
MATKILAFCGSLRKGSYNRMALNAAKALAPDGVEIESFDELGDVPPYNEDVREAGFPPVIETLREQVRAADALVFGTPEYNYSVPGVLKNAIDWVSRPPDQPFKGKPCAVMGASISMLGGARAQYHLRQSMVFLDMHPVNQPEVMIAAAKEKFDADGKLTDETSKKLIRQLVENLVAWTKRLG